MVEHQSENKYLFWPNISTYLDEKHFFFFFFFAKAGNLPNIPNFHPIEELYAILFSKEFCFHKNDLAKSLQAKYLNQLCNKIKLWLKNILTT